MKKRGTVMAEEKNDSEITPRTIVSSMVRPKGKYTLSVGDVLGAYTIRKPLGRGGMGEVYLALHTNLNVLRAVKILPPDESGHTGGKYGKRFLQEARMVISLEHPNIISVYDADFDPVHHVYYMVMEFVDGGSVRSALRTQGPYPERKALLIAMKTAEALSAAEKRQLVHRDIKPDNIMIKRNGSVKVGDFGIAKTGYAESGWSENTEKVSMTGTPAYMSPEQVMNPDTVDGRADIYSLGVTLYEMLTGVKPYSGQETVDVLKLSMKSSVPDPRDKNPNISKAAAELVMRMMQKKREKRPENADALVEEIRGLLENEQDRSEDSEQRPGVSGVLAAGMFPLRRWTDWLSERVQNHWLLTGVTAGIVFFLLTA